MTNRHDRTAGNENKCFSTSKQEVSCDCFSKQELRPIFSLSSESVLPSLYWPIWGWKNSQTLFNPPAFPVILLQAPRHHCLIKIKLTNWNVFPVPADSHYWEILLYFHLHSSLSVQPPCPPFDSPPHPPTSMHLYLHRIFINLYLILFILHLHHLNLTYLSQATWLINVLRKGFLTFFWKKACMSFLPVMLGLTNQGLNSLVIWAGDRMAGLGSQGHGYLNQCTWTPTLGH